MPYRSERADLEMNILKYRQLVQGCLCDPLTAERINGLITELEQRLRTIDS